MFSYLSHVLCVGCEDIGLEPESQRACQIANGCCIKPLERLEDSVKVENCFTCSKPCDLLFR